MKDDDPLTLSHLLNIIDGMIEMPGRIIILTTNHINKLDPALIREGRIDIKVEMKKASRNIVKQMFNWFYKKELDNDILQKMPDMHFTPAKISNIFYKNHDNSEMAISELISN
jgi:chaperone BCS1